MKGRVILLTLAALFASATVCLAQNPQINNGTLALTGKKDGKVTLTGRIVASANGRTRTITTTGTDSQGKRFSNRAVYDKE